MRKKLGLLLVGVCAVCLFITGCGKPEEKLEQKTMTCTLNRNDVVSNYSLKSTYKVLYTGEVVDKVETEEVITSDNAQILSTFEEQLNSLYHKMDDTYGGYDISVTNDGTKVVSLVKIDYSKLNLAQLIKDEPTMKNYTNGDNRLTVSGIKAMYTSQGSTCE